MQHFKKTVTSFLALSLCAASVFADVLTNPVGVVLVPIKGGGAATIISSGGLVQARVFQGVGTLASGTSLTIAESTWETNAYAGTHYVQLETGDWAPILSNTGNVLTLEEALEGSGSVSFKIHPLQTLDSMFGSNNAAGFTGGESLGVSDMVSPWDQATQDFSGYYYYNTTRSQWEDSSSNYVGNTVVYPDEAMIIIGQNDVNLRLLGEVQLGGTSGLVAGEAATSLVPNPYPIDLKISEAGLESTIQGGATFGVADWVLVWDATLQKFSKFYYYDTDDSLWKDASGTVVTDADVIETGTAAVVIKNSTGGSNWEMTQPFTLSD